MTVDLDVHQRKGVLKTVIIGIGLFLVLLFFGLRHYDPPLQRGIIIALGSPDGTSDQSNSTVGENAQSAKAQETPTELEVTEVDPATTELQIENSAENPTETAAQSETQTEQKVLDESPATNEELLVDESSEVSVAQQTEPKPDAATSDALKRILGGQSAASKADTASGDSSQNNETAFGSEDGSPLSDSPYNLGIGLDGDGNYLLGGRRALYKEIIVQECNQAGRVVVSIEVNQQGQVITAMPGVRGTTNNAPCLLDPARRAALATEFNPDSKAPSRQIGKIIYVFRLSQ